MRTSSPTDVLNDLASGWADAVQRWWGDAERPSHRDCDRDRDYSRDCGCGCGDDCRCCVPRADVVVHARVGERRVVAFALRNPRHREREVSLEVGPWHRCGDEAVDVQAAFDVGSPVTLSGCEQRVARLSIGIGTGKDDGENRVPGDVAACTSAYADVRFEGCSRPQRVAVVVHPASCDAVDADCDCGCC